MTDLTRRSLITGLVSLVAAPAIVRVSSIMPVRPVQMRRWGAWNFYNRGPLLVGHVPHYDTTERLNP